MNPLKKKHGFAILSVVIAGVILSLSYFAVAAGLSKSRNISLTYRDTIIAETYAAELLELFRSMQSDRLRDYFSLNPINQITPAPVLPPYFLCSLINYLKPGTNTLLNEDPIAALPANVLGGTANRYYQIHLVDRTTLNPDFNACQFNMSNLPAGSLPQASNDSRFYVTVGVSWLSPIVGNRNVTVSTLIP